MINERPKKYQDVKACVDDIIKFIGKDIRFGMPLALGKPIQLINELYERAKNDPTIKLTILTALSLEKPTWSSELEERFLKPFVRRVWNGVPDFQYILDIRKNQLPSNVNLKEFYFKAGQYMSVPEAQQNYISSNYTHVIRDAVTNGVNVFSNIVSKSQINNETFFSMSCNADISIDGVNSMRKAEFLGKKRLSIAQINSNLPFMYGDAVVKPDIYDMVIENPDYDFQLFSAPRPPVFPADHMTGLYVSSLIKDGGTLQIGIGALGDAIASGLKMRHQNNTEYNAILKELGVFDNYGSLIKEIGGVEPFEKGLYGSTEMFVDAFLQLYKLGIMKRRVYHNIGLQRLLNEGKIQEKVTSETIEVLLENKIISSQLTEEDFAFMQKFGIIQEGVVLNNNFVIKDGKQFSLNLSDPDSKDQFIKNCLGQELKTGVVLTGAFFIGPRDFYGMLKNMSDKERKNFEMTSVLVANQLYGDEVLRSLQRKDGRFINTGMKVTLSGAIASDALDDGRTVSGVGGQYNFVAMAHALPDARLIMMIKSTRVKDAKVLSNIVYNYGEITIPRQLRDIVVTEYGIADLRGKCNKDIVAELLNIMDSRFQDELLREAKAHKRIPGGYQIPDRFKNNYPEKNEKIIKPYREKGFFQGFPFGTDLTEEEIVLGRSLKKLKESIASVKSDFKTDKFLSLSAGIMRKMLKPDPEKAQPYLERMGLDKPKGIKEKMLKKMVVYALELAGQI